MDVLNPEWLTYLEKHPAVYFAACRKIPDLFIWHVLGAAPCKMHVELQRYMDEAGGTKRVQMSRNHGKTTQLSIGRVAWLVGNNPNLRVQIIQNNRPDASKTVKAIKEVFESDKFKQVFPEIQPNTEEWGKLQLSVKRDRVGLRDPTVSAQPIFGAAGSRADLMIFDDIENLDNSIRQPAMREQVKEAYRNTWLPVLEPGGQEWDISTPWHVDGISMDWRRDSESGGPAMFFRACEGTVRSPWPEKFTHETLADLRRKMGEIAYTRAYELKPLSGDETVFKEADLLGSARPLPDRDALRSPVRWATLDLAYSEDTQGLKGRSRNEADWSVMAVADIDSTGNIWMVEVMRRKCSYPDFKARALAMAQRSNVARIKIEANGPQKGIAQDIAQAFNAVGISCRAEQREAKDKYSRAAMQQHVVEQGRFHLRTMSGGELMPDMRPMLVELSQFPLGSHDDMVDVAVDLMAEAKVGGIAAPLERGHDYTLARDIEAALNEPVAVGADEYAAHHSDWMDRD